MRRVRLSKTYERQLIDLLDFGERTFGRLVADASKHRIDHTIRTFLAAHPAAKTTDAKLGLTRYPVSRTPFVLLFDFHDNELRVHFIFHRNASLDDLDPRSARW